VPAGLVTIGCQRFTDPDLVHLAQSRRTCVPELARKRVRRGSFFCVDDLENAHSRNSWRHEMRTLSRSSGPPWRCNYCLPNLRTPHLALFRSCNSFWLFSWR
jgi:hypothetical protein